VMAVPYGYHYFLNPSCLGINFSLSVLKGDRIALN
jgi:hypothetical protein